LEDELEIAGIGEQALITLIHPQPKIHPQKKLDRLCRILSMENFLPNTLETKVK